MAIHPPTKEQVENIPYYLTSPYLDEVQNLQDVIHNARVTDTKPDISSFHEVTVNAVDPKLLPKKKQEDLAGTNPDTEPGVSFLQKEGEYDWRIEAGQANPMHDHGKIPPKVKKMENRSTNEVAESEEGYKPAYSKKEIDKIYEESHAVSEPVAPVSTPPLGAPSGLEPGEVNYGEQPPQVQSQVQQNLDDVLPSVKELEPKPDSKVAPPVGSAKVKADKGNASKPIGTAKTADEKNAELRKLAGNKDKPSAAKVQKELKELEKEHEEAGSVAENKKAKLLSEPKPVARKRPAKKTVAKRTVKKAT